MYSQKDIDSAMLLLTKYDPKDVEDIKFILDTEGLSRKDVATVQLFNIAFQIYNRA